MNIFNSWMFYLILSLSASTLGFGYLSYRFHGDKVEAEYSLVQVIDANTELQKSLNLRDLSCKIDNEVVSEYQAEKKVQQDKVKDTVSKISALPSTTLPKKPIQVSPKVIAEVQQDAQIDIDYPLPDSIISLLRESCVQGEGDACVSP